MLSFLYQIEKILPKFLSHPDQWNSLYVDYHPPIVERLWMQWKENRIYLHKIYPCKKDEALFHSHPWPQAAKILTGQYEMNLGYGQNAKIAPPIAATLIITSGTAYEMLSPDSWHSVRPLQKPSLSVMVTGVPWKKITDSEKKQSLQPLKEKRKQELIKEFLAS